MKTLRLIGMAVAAVMLSVATTSCDDDDDDNDDNNTQTEVSEDGIVVGEKKLVAVTEIEIEDDGDEYETTYTITYDSEGRLSTILKKQPSHITTQRYEWGDGTITEYLTEGGKTYTYTYTLSGNLVTKVAGDCWSENYTYKSNRVTTYEKNETGDTDYCTFTWDGDKLISEALVESSDNNKLYSSTYTYSYSGKTCNGFFPDDWISLETIHPELFGSRRNQLPDYMIQIEDGYGNENERRWDYTYTFDEDGYVKTMTVVRTESNGYSDTYYYTYTWE